MNETKKGPKPSLSRKLGAQFLAGILITVPVGVTLLILAWIFSAVDNILQPTVLSLWGRSFPGVGVGITLLLIYLVGLIASNVLGRRLISYGESLLDRVPIFKYPYSGIRRVLEAFAAHGKSGFMQVVLVEFPRKGMSAIGFVTAESPGEPGKRLLNVYVPASPNPTSGFLQIMREDEVVRTNIPVDAAVEMLISAGRTSPGEVFDRLS